MDDARQVIVSDYTTAIGYIPRLAGALLIFLIGGAIAWDSRAACDVAFIANWLRLTRG